jgi:hypothetical protein
MKGYVKVTTKQIQEAIDGFTFRHNEGKRLRDIGIDLYYQRYFVDQGSLYTKWRFKKMTPIQFARKDIKPWDGWSDILYKVMTEDETNKIHFWGTHRLSALDGPNAMVTESTDGFALVDSEMAKTIQTYRGYLE